MRASKFIDGIDLDNNNKKYNLVDIFIDSNNSNMSKLLDPEKPPT